MSVYGPPYGYYPFVWDTFYYQPARQLPWTWDIICSASSETRRSMIRDAFPGITDADLVRASQRLDQVCLERALPGIYRPGGQVAPGTTTSTPVPWGWVVGGAVSGVIAGWIARSIL